MLHSRYCSFSVFAIDTSYNSLLNSITQHQLCSKFDGLKSKTYSFRLRGNPDLLCLLRNRRIVEKLW